MNRSELRSELVAFLGLSVPWDDLPPEVAAVLEVNMQIASDPREGIVRRLEHAMLLERNARLLVPDPIEARGRARVVADLRQREAKPMDDRMRECIAGLLRDNPEASDREVARQAHDALGLVDDGDFRRTRELVKRLRSELALAAQIQGVDCSALAGADPGARVLLDAAGLKSHATTATAWTGAVVGLSGIQGETSGDIRLIP